MPLGMLPGRVVIAQYHPAWPALFAEEAARLQEACGLALLAIEHIGSTAVPGLAAKPIIDLMPGVASFEAAITLVPAVEALGYAYLGEFGIARRHYFRKGDGPEPRTHHLHMVEVGGEFWERHLLFRDYLRSHPETAAAYAAMKRDAATVHGIAPDTDAYTEAKSPFIAAVLKRARRQ
ncbi:MAG: GrpB family protein [Tepidiformaceae bacterium]